MQSKNWQDMKGLAECPDCHDELAALLQHAHKWARCRCGCRFMLPSASILFNNAAVYLVINDVSLQDQDRLADLQVAG